MADTGIGARLRGAAKRLAGHIGRLLVFPIVKPALQAMLDADARNLPRLRQLRAAARTADFIDAELPAVQSFPSGEALLTHALSLVDPAAPGLVCEFGVYQGRSLRFIAARVRQPVFGFDAFQGLPEDWQDGLPRGAFRTPPPEVPPNVTLVVGWFAETLAPFLASHPGDALLLHVDSDLYASCRTVLDAFARRIRPGTILVFDEYFNHPAWEQGEHRAFREAAASHGWSFEYLGYAARSEQLAIRITAVAPKVGPPPRGEVGHGGR